MHQAAPAQQSQQHVFIGCSPYIYDDLISV